eukprot:TRINITY_DN12871_c0_g1_i1.p1 TRINITY_DN12871_c0_g1~~TRINITY_DN12871_c0_g1_i1.p1  ORF type:complete len:183 (-),score=40.12 TRINITY_DN12871_c0_g1_i1:331-879(-)
MFSTRKILLLILSTFSMVFGIITLVFQQRIFNTILHSQLVIEEGTAAYNAWVETPIPVYTKFYFFDMLNPSDLFHSHEKPILEERGPYTFREVEKKVNLNWHANGTISYRRVKFWYFERELSVGPLTDKVTTSTCLWWGQQSLHGETSSWSGASRTCCPPLRLGFLLREPLENFSLMVMKIL